MKKKYTLEHLGCAHCAAKMEEKINQLDGVTSAVISYPMKQLILEADDPDHFLSEVQRICNIYEEEVVVIPKETRKKSKKSSHDHEEHHHHDHDDCCDDDCCCGHDHDHEEHHHHHDHDDCCDDDDCCCGHDHDHEEHHHHHDHDDCDDDCCCGHDHDHEEHHHHHDHDDCDDDCCCGHDHDHEGHHHHDEHHHEDAHHEESHSHSHAQSGSKKLTEKQDLILGIVLAVAAYIIGALVKTENIELIAYLIAYLFLAKDIIRASIHNIGKGQIFDENFLMSVASIGAFLIGEYPEALGVILFYRIGEAFEDYAVERSRASIMETVNMRPETVLLVHGDHTHKMPAEDIEEGEIIMVRPGDRVPLDGIVTEGSTQLDTSALTGEPVPVTASVGDSILSGCVNQTGVIKLKVTSTLDESMVTRIMESMENAAASKPKIDRFITRFARVYTPFVVLVAALTAIIPSVVTGNWSHWVYTALTFLVISCPCALVLSVPLAFFSGIGLGSKKGILFKGGASLEVLKDVKAVVMDKTGTITEGNFVVQQTETADGIKESDVLCYSASCEQNSTHPIAKSILTAAKEGNIKLLQPEEVSEAAGHGIKATIEGKKVLCGNQKLMDAENIKVPALSSSYGTEVFLAIDGKFAGRLLISDTLKDDSKASIAKLNESVHTVMLTGDSENSAKAIAEETGIQEYRAKLLPDEKLSTLQELRKNVGPVMFVGDGINDAPVLAGADCGAAMGSGADAAIEAADVVFMTSKLSAIPEAIRIAKKSNFIAIENIVFALAVKAAIMILGIFGIASMWMAVFADTGVAAICIVNSIRILRDRK